MQAVGEELLLQLHAQRCPGRGHDAGHVDRKSTRLNSSHLVISYAVFCLKKKKKQWSPHDYLSAPPYARPNNPNLVSTRSATQPLRSRSLLSRPNIVS